MAPKFGTSGVRGLVTELTQDIVTQYVSSFVQTCDTNGTVYVGWDLRESSPLIADWVINGLTAMGQNVVSCGVLPTPALAFSAGQANAGAIMITGSHIPADRNGIKFYTIAGEISKRDEAQINAYLDASFDVAATPGGVVDGHAQATKAFVARYVSVFSQSALADLTVGLYQHSSVARDILAEIFSQLGATVVPLERTETFVPVDTEAVDPAAREKFARWCRDHQLDALVSTDGDADRPMVTDHTGTLVPGDVLGALTAKRLGAKHLCTPVSSNTMITQMSDFTKISLTKIGSPYVVAAIEQTLSDDAEAEVIGYEANGGFLLGFEARFGNETMAPLLTRDCVLPMLAPLVMMKEQGGTLSELVATLPNVFTAADRLVGIEADVSGGFISSLVNHKDQRDTFFEAMGQEISLDTTDGLRVTFENGETLHLRPSGNAPECRCYAEAATASRAQELVAKYLSQLSATLNG